MPKIMSITFVVIVKHFLLHTIHKYRDNLYDFLLLSISFTHEPSIAKMKPKMLLAKLTEMNRAYKTIALLKLVA